MTRLLVRAATRVGAAAGVAVCAAAVLAGCSGTPQTLAPDAEVPPERLGGDRPVALHVPTTEAPAAGYPLLIVLHGAGASGDTQLDYLGFRRLVEEQGVLLLAPDGTLRPSGSSWWDFIGDSVDDLGYLTGLVDEVARYYPLDPRRVFLFGHSNGAAMAHELACAHSDPFAAAVTLAHGVRRASTCQPTSAVSILQLHADTDEVVPYTGLPLVFGAVESVEIWAERNGCQKRRQSRSPRADIDVDVAGAETELEQSQDCPPGVDVELWTMRGGKHVPSLAPDFPDQMWRWLDEHRKTD